MVINRPIFISKKFNITKHYCPVKIDIRKNK